MLTYSMAWLVVGWVHGLTELLFVSPAQPGGEGVAAARMMMMPELGAKGPISQSWGASHDPAANPWRLPEPQILSHCSPQHQEPNTLRVTSNGQRSLTKGTDPKGLLHEKPSWEETPENLCSLTCFVEFIPAHPKSTH